MSYKLLISRKLSYKKIIKIGSNLFKFKYINLFKHLNIKGYFLQSKINFLKFFKSLSSFSLSKIKSINLSLNSIFNLLSNNPSYFSPSSDSSILFISNNLAFFSLKESIRHKYLVISFIKSVSKP